MALLHPLGVPGEDFSPANQALPIERVEADPLAAILHDIFTLRHIPVNTMSLVRPEAGNPRMPDFHRVVKLPIGASST